MTDPVYADLSGWKWRVSMWIWTGVAMIWIPALLIGIGERRAAREATRLQTLLPEDVAVDESEHDGYRDEWSLKFSALNDLYRRAIVSDSDSYRYYDRNVRMAAGEVDAGDRRRLAEVSTQAEALLATLEAETFPEDGLSTYLGYTFSTAYSPYLASLISTSDVAEFELATARLRVVAQRLSPSVKESRETGDLVERVDVMIWDLRMIYLQHRWQKLDAATLARWRSEVVVPRTEEQDQTLKKRFISRSLYWPTKRIARQLDEDNDPFLYNWRAIGYPSDVAAEHDALIRIVEQTVSVAEPIDLEETGDSDYTNDRYGKWPYLAYYDGYQSQRENAEQGILRVNEDLVSGRKRDLGRLAFLHLTENRLQHGKLPERAEDFLPADSPVWRLAQAPYSGIVIDERDEGTWRLRYDKGNGWYSYKQYLIEIPVAIEGQL